MAEPNHLATQAPSPLRRLRFEAGDPTLTEVADASSQYGRPVDRSLISRLEKGERPISYAHASVLGPVFGKAPGELLKEMAEWYESRGGRSLSPTPDTEQRRAS